MIAHGPLSESGRAALPHPAPALGKDAEARYAGARSPWPVPFPPPPQRGFLRLPPHEQGSVRGPRLCPATSQVLWNCPPSHVRSSSAYVLRFPDAACGSLCRSRTRDLPFRQTVFPHLPRAGPAHTLRKRLARCCLFSFSLAGNSISTKVSAPKNNSDHRNQR